VEAPAGLPVRLISFCGVASARASIYACSGL
jgi:hypothetical protein